jgi:hypothetical protein
MKFTQILIGFLIGLLSAFLGGFLFLLFFSDFNLFSDFNFILQSGILGKVLKLGALLNLVVFFLLLKFNKDDMARGIIITFVVLTLFAFFI